MGHFWAQKRPNEKALRKRRKCPFCAQKLPILPYMVEKEFSVKYKQGHLKRPIDKKLHTKNQKNLMTRF